MADSFRILAAAIAVLLSPTYFKAGTAPGQGVVPAARAGDEYRLVYPASCAATLKTFKSEAEEVRHSKFDDFVAQLNRAGAEGYRLTSFTYVNSGVPFGVVRRAGVAYEYAWLEMRDEAGWLRGPGGFEEKFAELSRRGFRLVDYALFDLYCNPLSPSYTNAGDPTAQTCASLYVFLLGREVGAVRPVRFAVVGSHEEKLGLPAAAEVKRRLSEGLFPRQVFSGYEIWFEDGDEGDPRWAAGAEVELVWYDRSWWARDIMKRVNEAAKRGYRVGLTKWGTALMYRQGDSAGFTYTWLRAKQKEFEKHLARLQASGAVYVTTYRDEDELVFERRLADDGKRREYRVLNFEFTFREEVGGRVRIALAPQGLEALSTLRGLSREGFAVRDAFYPKTPALILERQ
jgi:hypothetical protein